MSTVNKAGSYAWLLFTKVEGQEKAKCNNCDAVLTYKQSSTSSLLKHSNNKHHIQTEHAKSQFEAKKRKSAGSGNSTASATPNLVAFINWKAKMSMESSKSKVLTRSIIRMIAVDLQPLSLVEDEGFRSFSTAAEGGPVYIIINL